MRKPYPFYSLLTLGGLFLAGSCSIIAEVDRTKIPTDGGTTPEGGQGSGGSSGAGGKGGTSGAAGSGPTGGTTGEAGMGGEPGGGSGGAGGEPGGTGGEPGGMGGEGGSPPTAECGNNIIETGEQCDDDDADASDGCSATCQVETGWTCTGVSNSVCTPICGDGVDVGAAEVCDDGNSAACGTCAGNATGTASGCTFAVTPTAAAGSVTPVGAATLADGTTFTLNDGYNPAVTFEFDSSGTVAATATAIVYTVGTTDPELRTAIIDAVNGVAGGLLVTASAGTAAAPAVTLTHDRATTLGNQAVVGSSSADVTVVGMTGGLAGNCPSLEECSVDADCASLDCNSSNLCTAP